MMVKTIGSNQSNGRIFCGTLDTKTNCWIGRNTDVTDIACQLVAETLYQKDFSRCYQLDDGTFLVLRVDVCDALPADFLTIEGADNSQRGIAG